MKLKRVFVRNEADPRIAVWSKGRWMPLLSVLAPDGKRLSEDLYAFISDMLSILRAGESTWKKLQKIADEFDGILPETEPAAVLPFDPLSYRDFMLFEAHFIGASRGWVRCFRPWVYSLTSAYEGLFKRTFPAFRPGPFWYKNPMYYMGNHLNFVTDGHPVAFPSYTKSLDYELELGAVIVHPLKDATPREAVKAIGGFVVLNDFSARDVQLPEMRSGFGPVKSKNFINAVSAEVVTADEILPRINELKGEVRINGELITQTTTEGMQHNLGRAIAYASLSEQLHPGEFVATGTLPGGCGMENGRWLSPGDTITLSIEGIGDLSNPIV